MRLRIDMCPNTKHETNRIPADNFYFAPRSNDISTTDGKGFRGRFWTIKNFQVGLLRIKNNWYEDTGSI